MNSELKGALNRIAFKYADDKTKEYIGRLEAIALAAQGVTQGTVPMERLREALAELDFTDPASNT